MFIPVFILKGFQGRQRSEPGIFWYFVYFLVTLPLFHSGSNNLHRLLYSEQKNIDG
jgi:hypothetical protein